MVIKIIKYFIVFVVYAGIFLSLQRLLVPKYMSEVYDGALINEYYAEDKNHSVIFIGDCEVYQNFSPHELFREYGITSYIRGGASQTIWQSYWLLEDTLKYETPQVVVLSILGMGKDKPVSEPFNRLNIEGMKLSSAKIGAAKSSMTYGENTLDYIFPIFRYHDRWSELTKDDFKYFFKNDNVGLNGYLMRSETVPMTIVPKPEYKTDEELEFSEMCWEYLNKIRKLCDKKGIELILFKSPAVRPHWYSKWDSQITDYAEKHSLFYYNILDPYLLEKAKIDYSTDTANAGLHMNVNGAEKLSRWLGAELTKNFSFPDYRNNPEVLEVWERKIRDYVQLHAIQLKELEKDNKVSTITYLKS